MGTKMAPAYANLYMGLLETKLTNENIHLWRRYIDDIFIIWTGNYLDLQTYLQKINSIHPTIKFTSEVSDKELTFLDVTLYKGERFSSTNVLDIRTHIKETNKQLYVHKSSYHPPNTKKAVMKGEMKRYLRTNSQQNENTTNQQTKNKRIFQK